LRWFEEICVTADVPIMEGREDIEGEQFCAMDEQSCSEIVQSFKLQKQFCATGNVKYHPFTT